MSAYKTVADREHFSFPGKALQETNDITPADLDPPASPALVMSYLDRTTLIERVENFLDRYQPTLRVH
jgi:hypothetical protein